MIRNISELLKGFMDEEKSKLDKYLLKHSPTIGQMYEGLTHQILEKTIPEGIELFIKRGFIHDGLGNLSGEIDCMLVEGKGEKIPFTESYKWHVKDVIAVLEVKKNLFSSELKDSFSHLRSVLETHDNYIHSQKGDENFLIESALKTFAQITGTVAPKRSEVSKLSFNHQMIYHSLIVELLTPIRIVIGYGGFKKEKSLRDSFKNFIEDNLLTKGFGVISFPQLIISNKFSLVKLNGQPYTTKISGDYWNFYASSRTNPILLMLEFIWTRLAKKYSFVSMWGEDLTMERLAVFLSGKAIQKDDYSGWEYKYVSISHNLLSKEVSDEEWSPTFLTSNQFVVMNRLCLGETEKIDDVDLIEWIKKDGQDPEAFIESLIDTGLVAINKNKLQLITDECQCVVLPDGRYAAAENNTGRLTRYLLKIPKA